MFLLFILALFVGVNVWGVSVPVESAFLTEQGPLEMAQNVLVVLGFCVFFLSALLKTPLHKHKQACVLALMAFSILLREIEIQDYSLPDLVIWLGHGKGRTLLLLALWSVAIYYYREVFARWVPTIKQVLREPSTYLYIAGIVFLFAGMVFDKKLILAGNPLLEAWWEEVLEMNGYLLMLMSSLAFYREHLIAIRKTRGEYQGLRINLKQMC